LWFRNFKCFNFSRSIEQKFIAANFGMKTFTKIPVCKLCQTSFFANDLHTQTLIKLITFLRTSLIFHNVPPNVGTCFNNWEWKTKSRMISICSANIQMTSGFVVVVQSCWRRRKL
jgi:hypothetical protein